MKQTQIGRKRQLRKIKAKNNIKRIKELKKGWAKLVAGKKKVPKAKKEKKPLKPYRAVKLQEKHDAIYKQIRELDQKDPKRQKLLIRLSIIKTKLYK